MSAISTYLQRILNSIWARDVRQAIHDAIKLCSDNITTEDSAIQSLDARVTALEAGGGSTVDDADTIKF